MPSWPTDPSPHRREDARLPSDLPGKHNGHGCRRTIRLFVIMEHSTRSVGRGLAVHRRIPEHVTMKLFLKPERFWTEIDRIEGSAIPYVLRRTLVFGLIALLVTILHLHPAFPSLAIPMAPYEVLGVAMGALLVLRTNAGYERGGRGASSGAASSTRAVTS